MKERIGNVAFKDNTAWKAINNVESSPNRTIDPNWRLKELIGDKKSGKISTKEFHKQRRAINRYF